MNNYMIKPYGFDDKWDKYKNKEYYLHEAKYAAISGSAFGIAATMVDSIFMHKKNPNLSFSKILTKTPKSLALNFAIGTVGFFTGRILGNLLLDFCQKDKK